MYPCPWPTNESSTVYTFYAITTLLVVVLAICLVWNPVVHLIRELNTIFARVIIYTNKEMFGYRNACFFARMEAFLTSQIALCTITFFCIVFALYLASGDFLRFAGCYVCHWPESKALEKVKSCEGDVEYDYFPGTDHGTNKLVLVVRNDLKMGKGKVAAQCSHAAVLAHELSRKKCPDIFADWKRNGQPKIVVKVDNEEEMMHLAERAREKRLLSSIVKDAGRTQIPSDSRTVLAIGPGPENLVDEITGYLKLY